MEIAVLKRNDELKFLTDTELEAIVKQIDAEKAAEEAASSSSKKSE